MSFVYWKVCSLSGTSIRPFFFSGLKSTPEEGRIAVIAFWWLMELFVIAVREDQTIERYGINAVCTHLGCVVSIWAHLSFHLHNSFTEKSAHSGPKIILCTSTNNGAETHKGKIPSLLSLLDPGQHSNFHWKHLRYSNTESARINLILVPGIGAMEFHREEVQVPLPRKSVQCWGQGGQRASTSCKCLSPTI